jgi:hypothetical protein
VSQSLDERLNQILPRITSQEFLSGDGIGNEIACYIFDYDPKDELRVREHINLMIGRLETHHKDLSVLHLNMLDVCKSYLESRKLLDRAMAMHTTKSDAGVIKALQGPLAAEKLRDYIAGEYRPAEYDLVLLSGVGSMWPVVRAHSLLNTLHTVMDLTPMVMFYPGSFDGTTLRLFGQITTKDTTAETKSYYRAFILVPRETHA